MTMKNSQRQLTGCQLKAWSWCRAQTCHLVSSVNLLGVVHFQVLLHQLLHGCTPGNHCLVHYLQHSIKDELQREQSTEQRPALSRTPHVHRVRAEWEHLICLQSIYFLPSTQGPISEAEEMAQRIRVLVSPAEDLSSVSRTKSGSSQPPANSNSRRSNTLVSLQQTIGTDTVHKQNRTLIHKKINKSKNKTKPSSPVIQKST